MSLGQLALHVATLPRQLTEFVTGDALDFGVASGAPPTVSSPPGAPGRIRLLVYLRLLNVPVHRSTDPPLTRTRLRMLNALLSCP
jgi:hypothetical protein